MAVAPALLFVDLVLDQLRVQFFQHGCFPRIEIGRILFERQWLDELKRAMEGEFPQPRRVSRPTLPNIHVELGVPEG